MIDPGSPDFSRTPASPFWPRYSYRLREPASPVISIVTPFYNTGPVFLETISTVLHQSFQQWEWIIVDDGSTDCSALAVLAERDDQRVRIVPHETNRGLSAARNTGYRAAQSHFVYQLDSDDLIEPTALEKCLWHMFSHPEYSFTSSLQVGFQANEYLFEKGFHSREEFLLENRTDPMALVRREVHEAIGGYDESNRGGLEDWDFWLNAAEHGYWGGTILEYLEWYRWRGMPNWPNWDWGENQAKFTLALIRKYPRIYSGNFPALDPKPPVDPGQINLLLPEKPRVLVLAESIQANDANDASGVAELGAEISFLYLRSADRSAEARLTEITPELFILEKFLADDSLASFLRYFEASRAPEIIVTRALDRSGVFPGSDKLIDVQGSFLPPVRERIARS